MYDNNVQMQSLATTGMESLEAEERIWEGAQLLPGSRRARRGGQASSLLDIILSEADSEIFELLLNVVQIDEQINGIKKAMRARNAKKKALNEKIRRLRDALANSSAKDPDDLVYVAGGLKSPGDQAKSIYADNKEKQHNLEKEWKDNYYGPEFLNGVNPHASDEKLNEMGYFRMKEVEAELENLKTQLDDLNTGSQLEMLTLQQLHNYRNQNTVGATNLLSTRHRTAMKILEGWKG